MKHIKGEPRLRTENARRRRALLAKIPDQRTFDAFLSKAPAAERWRIYVLLDDARFIFNFAQ